MLDRIDEIVPPGTDLNDTDVGWVPAAIADPSLRRRPAEFARRTFYRYPGDARPPKVMLVEVSRDVRAKPVDEAIECLGHLDPCGLRGHRHPR